MPSRLSTKLLTQLFWLLVILFVTLAITRDAGLLPKNQHLAWLCVAGGALVAVRYVILRRFREYEFTPLRLRDLPRATPEYFQTNAAELDEVGFTQLGDFVLLPDPRPLATRFLISGGKRCLAEVSHWDGNHIRSFVSVTASGRFFETTSFPGNPHVGKDVPLDFLVLPSCELLQLLEIHIQRVREYEAQTGCEALVIEPEKFRDVVNYGHRLASLDCFQQGFLSSAPGPVRSEVDASEAMA